MHHRRHKYTFYYVGVRYNIQYQCTKCNKIQSFFTEEVYTMDRIDKTQYIGCFSEEILNTYIEKLHNKIKIQLKLIDK